MIASSVTPPLEEEKAEVHGREGVGEFVISIRGCFGRSRASLSNRRRANGTYDGKEMITKDRDRDRKMTNDLLDSQRENEFIMCHCISIDINERENEVRTKVYREVL